MSVAAAAESVSADRSALALLSAAAVALSGPAEPEGLLVDLMAGLRRALDAERACLLLLEADARRLAPAVAVARRGDDELWQRFRRMPPIELEDLPGAAEVLGAGRVVLVDAARSGLVPPAWQRAFGLRALALAPVCAREAAVGLLAVEQAGEPAELSAAQLALLEGMAALVGVALAAVGAEALPPPASLLDWSRAIAGANSQRAIAERTLSGILELTGATEGTLTLIRPGCLDVLAVRGLHQPEPGRHPIASVPKPLREACARAWAEDPHRVVSGFIDGAHLSLFPMVAAGQVHGAAALATPAPLSGTRAPALLAEVAALALRAEQGAADEAWSRRGLEVAAALFAAAEAGTGLATALQVSWALLADYGLTVVEAAAADAPIAKASGLGKAAGALAASIGAWRRTGPPELPAACQGGLAFPLVGGGGLVGALLVRADGELGSRELGALRCVAGLAGAAIAARVQASKREELARVAAQAAAHRAVAANCYTEAGTLIARLLEAAPATSVAQARTQQAEARLALGQLRRLLRDAGDALSLTPPPGAGLKGALGAFARRVQAATGIGVALQTEGRLPRLAPASQVALLHALAELSSTLREARAALIQINVAAGAEVLSVELAGDGALLSTAAPEGVDLHSALRRTRAWLAPLAGTACFRLERGGVRFSLALPARTPPRPPPPEHCPGSGPAHLAEVVRPLS